MKPRVRSVTQVPRTRPQRTPPAQPTSIDEAWPTNSKGWHPTTNHVGRHTPGTLGRFPTIGIDRGAWDGAAPGDQLHNT